MRFFICCLTISYKEEESLFKEEIPKYFLLEEININDKIFKRYMDDGFLLWPSNSNSNFDDLCFCINKLLSSIRFIFKKVERIKNEKGEELKSINFLGITVILNKTAKVILRDIYYKTTNRYD